MEFKTATTNELTTYSAEKCKEHRRLRFPVAGSKNRNVKLARTLRRDIAQAETALSTRLNLV